MSKIAKIDVYLRNQLKIHAHRNPKSADTVRQYETKIKDFSSYVNTTRGTLRVKPTKELIQEYINTKAGHESPYTTHSRVIALTRACGLHAQDISHPRRSRPSKGRLKEYEDRTEGRTERNSRIYDIADKIGIRKDEYGSLKGKDLIERDSRLYVHVVKGKGGKSHDQLILPEDERAVKELFQGTDTNNFVFTKEEATGLVHAQTHAARRVHARRAYEYFHNLSDKEREPYRELVKERMLHKYDRDIRKGKYTEEEGRAKAIANYESEIEKIHNHPERICRGSNAKALREQGRSTAFDREAVLMTSVLDLAHYREDVTVTNYLI